MKDLKAQAELEILNKQLIANDGFLEAVTETHTTTKMQLNNKINTLKRQIAEAEVTYSTGDRFTYAGDKYILVYMGGDKIGLSNLRTGGCYKTDGYADDRSRITQAQFSDLSRDRTYFRYWDNRKQQKVSE